MNQIKRFLSIVFAVVLVILLLPMWPQQVEASTKKQETRSIAIVFDNSGSMYDDGDQAWCRATYAMEVFASMLNDGDVLQIYPMHEITINGKNYTMESPFQLTDASQASLIREIYTENAGGTPIESIDCAVSGLSKSNNAKKYLVVLTDGGTFSKNGSGLTKQRTKSELDKRFQENAGPNMTIMYLGIGSEACIPDTAPSEYFVKKQAVNSADVLSTLTLMCNQIFGRDTLPKKRISGNNVEFDISMSKLIVFVQGDNISNLKVNGLSDSQMLSSQQTKFSTAGSGDYKSVPDTSLQGMMVTYRDCSSGEYKIEYSGTADSIEVYYEPDADLDFVFTDAEGNTVDPNALYEGEYKVSFGMKDAKTGKLISSDLLGEPKYKGSYYINGQEYPITHSGNSGEVSLALKMNDTFDANLTVTYLSGYTISKDSSDFGWPSGGIKVTSRPAGELRLEITGGNERYSLLDLESGSSYIAKVYYKGELLTGSELEKVELKWNPDDSYVEIKKEFDQDHYNLTLHHKNPDSPIDTEIGECTVDINAFYTQEGSDVSQAKCSLTYEITEDLMSLGLELTVQDDYIVIKDIEESREIIAKLSINGAPLTPEQFSALEFKVDCDGIDFEITPDESSSEYRIKLKSSDNLEERDYPISVSAAFTDPIGRKTTAETTDEVTLSTVPRWVKWVLSLLLLLILAVIVWIIMHIKVLPKYMHTTRRLSSMNFDGDDVSQSTNFLAEIKKKSAKMQSQYGGRKFGISMDVTPGKESYLYKSQKRRSAEVKVASVRKFGPAKIQEAMIGSAKYVLDEDSGKLVPALPNQKPFPLTNGMLVKYSGTIQDAGIDKDFEVTEKLNFKKK